MNTSDQHERGTARRRSVKRCAVFSGLVLAVAATFGVMSDLDALPTGSAPVSDGDVEVFVGLSPTRVLDTRIGLGVDEVGPLAPGESITVDVAGVGPIPAEATSVAFNTAYPFGATSPSFLTIWKTGEERPFTAVNNATVGQVTPNFVISALGDGGRVDVYNDRGHADVVLDVAGYFLPLSAVDGIAGKGGPPWWTGDGPPAAAAHDVGDMYLDLTNLLLYGPKTASGWGTGRAIGPDGVGLGSRTLIEAGPPDVNIGVLGDVYLDTVTLNLYGPKTGGGWGSPISLDILDDLGPTFLTGLGVPLISLGDIGDTYLDTSTLNLYGPKTGGGWGSPVSLIQLPSAATDSALSAIGTAQALTIAAGSAPIEFPTDGASVGTAIVRDGASTTDFTLVEAGTYLVSYSVESVTALFTGVIEVHLDGSQVANTPSHPMLALGAVPTTGTVLVDADAGDTLQIVATGLSLGAGSTTSDLTVELVTLD